MSSIGDLQKATMRMGIIWIQALLFLCLSSVLAQAEEKGENRDILVIGTAPVVEENVARARTAAVGDALNKGVEQYLLRTLGDRGAVRHFGRVVRDLISTDNREVEKFTILAEERAGRHYKVLVRTRINESIMAERFRKHGIVLVQERPVNVLFLVSQVEQPENRVAHWWVAPEERTSLSVAELALHRVFEEFGFLAVNRLTRSLEGRYNPAMAAPDLSLDEAVQWGELFSVPVVVQGRCEIVDQREVHLFLEALGVEQKRVIAQDHRSEIASEGADELRRAMDKAIREIVLSMGPLIRKAVESGETASSRIEMVVKGLRSFRELRRIMDAFEKEVPGVQSVRQTRVAGDSVGLMVNFSGTREEFLQQIAGRETLPFVTEDGVLEDEILILRAR